MGDAKRRMVGPFAFGKTGLEEYRKAAEESIRMTQAAAAECLADDKFKRYMDMLDKAREATVEFLLHFQSKDQAEYAFAMFQITNEYRCVAELKNLVLKELRSKPVPQGVNENGNV